MTARAAASTYAENALPTELANAAPEWAAAAPRDHLLVFVHIPKTGGTSLKQWLTRTYGRYFTDHHPRMKPLDTHPARHELLAISSHVPYPYHQPYEEFADRTPLPFAVIRDPIDRAISFYNFVVTFRPHRLHEKTKGMDPREFFTLCLEDPMIAELRNGQCRVLNRRRESADLALERISREYLAVAPIGRIDELVDVLCTQLGLPPTEDSSPANKSPKLLQRADVDSDTLERLVAANAEDLALFEAVSSRSDLLVNPIADLTERTHRGRAEG